MNTKTLLLISAMGACVSMSAQNAGPVAFNSAGGSAVSGGNTQEWSIGEMTLVSTYTGSNLIVTQGVLQPSVNPTGIQEKPLAGDLLQVYPNPTENLLYLRSELKESEKLSCSLTDMSGKVVLKQDVAVKGGTDTQTLQLEGMSSGQYVLHVSLVDSHGTTLSNNYKIQKVH